MDWLRLIGIGICLLAVAASFIYVFTHPMKPGEKDDFPFLPPPWF